MKYEVTLSKPDGYVFRYAFETIAEVRDFMARTVAVMLPREQLTFRAI